ncbi:WD repeat-containing protein 27 isoform X2 [Parasteatoda tepidariorum]|uniref:WD repeat-containing protein 27 isoform X2 n=1 Tax=Parasteatoda tepidariorum TaxID=114398 RepID=UPI00077F8E27
MKNRTLCNPKTGKVLHSNMEQPLFSAFNNTNEKIAVSFTNELWIYGLKENSWVASIENVHFTNFNFISEGFMGIEDNCIKVWDNITNEIASKVSLSNGFPTSFNYFKPNSILVIGSTCGNVTVYEKNCRLIRSLSIWKIIAQNQRHDANEEDIYNELRNDSFPVHAIHVFQINNKNYTFNNLPEDMYLLVISSTCLFIFNINNEALLYYLNFNDELLNLQVGLIRSAAIDQDSNNPLVYITLIPVIGDFMFFMKIFLDKAIMSNMNSASNSSNKMNDDFIECHLSFLSKTDCGNQKSLLNHNTPSIKKINNIKKNPSALNRPVTFHSNIRSSGYGKLHKTVKLFQPQLSKVSKSKSLSCLTPRSCGSISDIKESFYNENKEISYTNLKQLDKIESLEMPTLSYLQATVDGMHAACPAKEGYINIFKVMKKTMKLHHTTSCHSGEINSGKWSHSGRLIITSGNDKTVKLWDFEKYKQVPLLVIGQGKNSLSTKQRFCFEEDVMDAQFYYLDRFLLAASGNKLHLFDYEIDIQKTGIKSIVNKSTLKLLKKIPLESKQITSFAAVNQYFSNLVLSAGTSKCIDVLDMTVGKVVWHSEAAGSKPPHVIAINEGSPFITQELQNYDLFLTSALIDGIKLWDLRTKQSVLSYKEHKCRVFPCTASFSPCGKYIATGSEDKSVYIYDLRQLSYVEKISEPQVDVFTSAVFTPKSQLILSTGNGSVYLYGKVE